MIKIEYKRRAYMLVPFTGDPPAKRASVTYYSEVFPAIFITQDLYTQLECPIIKVHKDPRSSNGNGLG